MRIVDDSDETLAIRRWADGGSALPLVSLYAERGELDRAAAVARMVLAEPDCQDAEAIEAILERASEPPEDWKAQLDDFAREPSLERWKDLMRFVPDELLYQRLRNSIRYLRKRGVDANVLFRCAADPGIVPDAIELVEEGLVSVETIVARGEGSPAWATFAGLAAQAAFLAGDLLGTIRFLRESIANESEWCSPLPHIVFVRDRASDEDHAALDRAGIPVRPEPEDG
jgi:hypothetical protein